MEQVAFLLQTYPILQHVIAVMVICRIVFKPIFSILGKYVELTIEEDDDKKLHKFMRSKTYKMLAFIVDMLASVKLPKIKK
jgi:hypothetical protein